MLYMCLPLLLCSSLLFGATEAAERPALRPFFGHAELGALPEDAETQGTVVRRFNHTDADGKSLDTREWPVVASNWPLPVEPEYEKPIKPGQTRVWQWSTGDLPEGWAQKAKLEVSYVAYKNK